MLLARRGLRVLAVESSRHGSDTLSTHALMRGGVLQLDRWGLLGRIEAAGTPAVRETSFHYGDEVVAVPIKPRDGVPALYAPRRSVLDALLADAAREAGAEVLHGSRVVDLVRSPGGRVEGAVIEHATSGTLRVQAGIVIGADGVTSTVARLAGAQAYRTGRHATAVVYGHWSGLAVDGYHWHYRPGVSTGVIPTNGGLTCVFAAMPARRFREEARFDLDAGYHRVMGECSPELAAAVSRGRRTGRLRGFAGQVGFFRQSWGPGWALVGDAAYFKDPLTAHGITDALRDAELLAGAVAAGSERALAEYQEARDGLSERLFGVTDTIASFEWDLPAVKQMHLALSEEMKREVDALVHLHRESAVHGLRTA
jgi:2-polyprenyl-6-methoxyphenol hydroxylase-like FAD-dependent oxidoreductase